MNRIASVQMNCKNGKLDENLSKILGCIDEACDHGAELAVLPEGIYQGYCFDTYEEIFPLAEEIPNGKFTQTLMKKAKERNTYIIAGLYEKEGIKLYNSAVFVGPDGYVGTYRKMHYFCTEKAFCEPSYSGFPVFDTRLGRIGIMICYDLWFPETMRLLTLQGADLICSPAGWVMNDTKEKIMKNPGNYNMPLENALCISASKCNSLYIAAAARVGEERGTKWTGDSLITAPSGEVLSSADGEHEKILYADVDLRRAKEYRQSGSRNNLFSDRRTDFYDEMLGLDAKRYIQ